jgi:PKD repeat protein
MFKLKFIVLSIVLCLCSLLIPLGIATGVGTDTKDQAVINSYAVTTQHPALVPLTPNNPLVYSSLPDIVKEKDNLTFNERKLSIALLFETGKFPDVKAQIRQAMESGLIFKKVPTGTMSRALTSVSNSMPMGKLVYVYVYTLPTDSTHIIDSVAAEVTDRDEAKHLAVAWVDTQNLSTLAALDGVKNIMEVVPPVVNMGSAMTQGDSILKTAKVRSTYGYSGAGIKIGVISSGVDHLSSAVASGDLPSNVHVLSNAIGGDEGTAMLEIVYDMVPNATLYFHDSGANTVAFDTAIDDLIANGCTVIVDDIGWIMEPFFQDGTVASHVNSVLSSNNIIYISSAGNSATSHYYGTFYPLVIAPANYIMYNGFYVNDFRNGINTNYPFLYVLLPPKSSIQIVLQWNDVWGASGNDYDLYLFDNSNGNLLSYSINNQTGTQNPLEYLTCTNPGSSTINGEILVTKSPTAAPRILDLYIYPNYLSYPVNILATNSIFGQQAVPNVTTVAAADWASPSTIEPYSSRGPVNILWPSAAIRQKPDITGVDNVSVTGAGGFLTAFTGTSAAAPSIAAVVAQIWGAYPTMTPAQVRSALYSTAVNLGPLSYDYTFGYGRADAFAMANSLTPMVTPTITNISPKNGPCAGGTSVTITGTGFSGTTAVNFGPTAATSFTVVSSTSITATSPAHTAGTVDVTVTTPGGASATSADDRFTYIAPAIPIITSVSPISAARSQTVYIKGGNFSNTTPQTFSLGDGSVDTFNSSTSPSLEIADNGGGSHNWSAGRVISINITGINFDAIGVIIVSWSDNEIVLGGFGSSLGINNSGIWNIGVGDPLVVNIWTQGGHALYNTTVSGSQAPVANFTATPTSGMAPLTVRFTDTSTNSPINWSWSFGDGSTDTMENPVHVYTGAGTYNVSLNATNAAGSNTVTKTGYITVTGSNNPTLVSAVTPTSRNAVVGSPVTVFMSVINAGTTTAHGVSIAQASSLPVTVSYQEWNGVTFIGTPNTPVDIPAGGAADFVLAITPTAAFNTSPLTFTVTGTDTGGGAPIWPVNTLTMRATSAAAPDVIMMSTNYNVQTGVNVSIAFAIATMNVGGAAATGVSLQVVVPSSITGLSYTVDQTDPVTGAIIGPATGLTINPGAQPTFAVFLTPMSAIPVDLVNNRITVQLVDGSGNVVGAVSVAVSTT